MNTVLVLSVIEWNPADWQAAFLQHFFSAIFFYLFIFFFVIIIII